MRKYAMAAAALLATASPALATGSIDCRTTDGSDIAIGGSIGRTVTFPLVSAFLAVGGRTMVTYGDDAQVAIGRSWVDRQEVRLDLTDPNAERIVASLRVRMRRDGRAIGALVHDGRRHPVTCEGE